MVELKIQMEPGKPATVTGPPDDKMLCYALLEIARDAVKDHRPAAIQLAQVFPALNGARR